MGAWQSCLKFKGCDQDGSFLGNFKEIEKTIIKDNNWSTITEDITNALNGKNNSLPTNLTHLSGILNHTLRLRADNPHWFFSPVAYIDYLLHNVPIPFVRFRERPYLTSWLGPKLASSNEENKAMYSELFNETFLMWSGREIATSNRIRCPLCEFICETPCEGTCLFSSWFKDTWGFCHQSITQ